MSNISVKTSLLINYIKKSSVSSNFCKRFNSSAARKLIFTEHGDPIKVVDIKPAQLREPEAEEVVVKLLAAPVNPVDINIIQGKYTPKPKLPAVPGYEGVGKIVKLGSNVKDFVEGDHVILLSANLGTWQTHLVLPHDSVFKVPKKLGIVEAATLSLNPCTAFRMLRDFTDLKPGDTVIQNGANSACGRNVIEICRTWDVRTVNIIRNRPNIDELKQHLTHLGATYVLTEEELRSTNIFKSGKIEKPKLALNCVGGKNALECLRHLQNGSPMVTYGGMSREPLTVPTSALIFKDLRIRGYSMTKWINANANSMDRFKMLSELISMMSSNKLHVPPYEMVYFDDYKEAILNTLTKKGMTGKKYILKFE